MKTVIDSIGTNNTLTVVMDSLLVNENPSDGNLKDTAVSVSETLDNSFWLKDGQPSGWTQVLLPVGITIFAVFLEKWIAKLLKFSFSSAYKISLIKCSPSKCPTSTISI